MLNQPRTTLLPGNNLEDAKLELEKGLVQRNENFCKQSGLFLFSIDGARIQISSFQPFPVGKCYEKLPKYLSNKHAIISVRNKDNRCFGYALLAALKDLPKEQNPTRSTKYSEEDFHHYGLDRLKYPVQLEDVAQIEQELGIGINVISYYDDEGRSCHPYFMSKLLEPQHGPFNLLLYENHWAWVKNLSRLMSASVNNHNSRRFWCNRCFSSFPRHEVLELH